MPDLSSSAMDASIHFSNNRRHGRHLEIPAYLVIIAALKDFAISQSTRLKA